MLLTTVGGRWRATTQTGGSLLDRFATISSMEDVGVDGCDSIASDRKTRELSFETSAGVVVFNCYCWQQKKFEER